MPWKKQLGLNRHIAVDVIQVNGDVICRLTGFEGLNGTVVVDVIGVEGGEDNGCFACFGVNELKVIVEIDQSQVDTIWPLIGIGPSPMSPPSVSGSML